MFRLPFAAGSVFSASMLDTLLYQAFVKDYLITFVRLLLGIDQAPGSGFLTSMQLTKDDLWIRTYGRLYQKLCSTTCEIPIGIYRTQDSHTETEEDYYEDNREGLPGGGDPEAEGSRFSSTDSMSTKRLSATAQHGSASEYRHRYANCFGACGSSAASFTSAALTVTDDTRDSHAQLIERAEIANLVRSRMQSLGLPSGETIQQISEKRSSLSYVIINPSCDLKIKEGDIIYLIRPSPFSAQKTFERHNSRRKSTLNNPGATNNADELHKAAFSLFQEKTSPGGGSRVERRRSSSGSVFSPCIPLSFTIPVPPPPTSPAGASTSTGTGRVPGPGHKLGVGKSNSLSLPDSPRQRSNSLRIAHTDDILIRRSNSLRQGLGFGMGGRRMSHVSHDEIGLPLLSNRSPNQQNRQTRMTLTKGSINFEVTPPLEDPNGLLNAVTPGTMPKSPVTLQGTIV